MPNILTCLLIVSALYAPALAEEPNEIPAKIAAAKEAFYAERDKADLALIALLERKQSAAKQAGDIKTIEAVRAEIEALRKQGTLPKTVPLKAYETALKSARARLENVYVGAIKTLVQQDQLEEAKKLRQDLDKFNDQSKTAKPAAATTRPQSPAPANAARPQPANADLFQNNSTWTSGGMKFKVLERKMDSCRVQYNTAVFEVVLEGTIKDGKFECPAKDVKLIKGSHDAASYSGILGSDPKGPKIEMTWRANNGGSGKFTMRPDASK